jgi:4-amino-4-deoxy-L-arabinose transferase-like glycosyltransferase
MVPGGRAPPDHYRAGVSRRTLVLLALGALAVRVVYGLWVLADGRYEPVSDAHHYHGIAAALADGRGFSHPFPFLVLHPTAWRPPLYPLLLGTVYQVTGPSVAAGQVLGAVLGTGVVVLGALLAERMAGPGAGVAAGVGLALYPPLVAADVTLLTESLSLLLLLAVVLLAGTGRWALAGVAAGLLTLTRPSAQALVGVIGLWLAWQVGWRRALVFVACAAAVVAPWVVRNWVQLGRPVLVTSNGFNLSALYSPEAVADDRWVDPVYDARLAALRAGVTDEAELDRRFAAHGWDSLRRDPGQVLRVVRRHVPLFFELDPAANEAPERLDGRSLRFRRLGLVAFYPVTAAGLVGMWRLWRRWDGQPLVLAAAYFAATSLVFVTVPRLRAPVDLVCVLAAAVLAADVATRAAAPSPARRLEPPGA